MGREVGGNASGFCSVLFGWRRKTSNSVIFSPPSKLRFTGEHCRLCLKQVSSFYLIIAKMYNKMSAFRCSNYRGKEQQSFLCHEVTFCSAYPVPVCYIHCFILQSRKQRGCRINLASNDRFSNLGLISSWILPYWVNEMHCHLRHIRRAGHLACLGVLRGDAASASPP